VEVAIRPDGRHESVLSHVLSLWDARPFHRGSVSSKFLAEPKWVGVGQAIYKANCVSCHGAEGGGNVGPNLCDENYKHIKQLTDIVKVINEGVAGGAMPAWAKRLSHKNDAILVSVYVASLRGSKPAKAKAPDGSPIAAWPQGNP
jgi:cytochrome c oxidase cbb3-type subunit 3